jgi:hypothetical protein
MFSMIFQSLMSLKNQGVTVLGGTTQGNSNLQELIEW